MGLVSGFWHKICEPLDGFLWHKDISHPVIRPVLRNQILAVGSFILGGAVSYAAFPWIFWFGTGLACMTWIFWSWARFFLGVNWGEKAFLGAILSRFAARLIFLAFLLYVALAWCQASGPAILAGMISGAFLALATFARYVFFPVGRK